MQNALVQFLGISNNQRLLHLRNKKGGTRNTPLNEIEKKAPQLAERMTPAIVQEWEQDFASRFGDMSSLGLGRIGKNGKKPEPMHAFNFMIAQLRSLLALEKLLPNQIGWGLILKKFRTFPQRLMTLSKKFKNILV